MNVASRPSAWHACLALSLVALGGCKTGRGADLQPVRAPFDTLRWGQPDMLPNAYDFLVDGRTGQVSQRTEFRQGRPVRVVVRDINPFLFEYRVGVNETRIAEADPQKFFNFAFGISLPASGATPPAASGPGTAGAAAGSIAGCLGDVKDPELSAANDVARELVQEFSNASADGGLFEQTTRLGIRFANTQRVARTTRRGYQAHLDTVLDANRRADTVRLAALEAARRLTTLSTSLADSSSALAPDLDRFWRGVGRYDARVDRAATEYPKCVAFKTTLRNNARELVTDSARYQTGVELLRQGQAEAERGALDLNSTARDPQRFFVTYALPPHRLPTDTRVLVLRRPRQLVTIQPQQGGALGASALTPAPSNQGAERRADTQPQAGAGTKQDGGSASTQQGAATADKSSTANTANTANKETGTSPPPMVSFDTVAQHYLRFGGRGHFTFSVGAGGGDLAQREYTTVTAYHPLPGGLIDTTSTIQYSQNSSGRISAMAALNVRVFDFSKYTDLVDGVHLTLGVGVTPTRQANVDLLFGTGFSLLDERIFLTGGYLVGQTRRLATGYSVGGQLPRGVSSVPSVSRTAARPGGAITFRVFPF